MAQYVDVLVRVKNMFTDDFEDTTEAFEKLGKEKFLNHIYEMLEIEMKDILSDQIEYVYPWSEYDEDMRENTILGVDDPNSLISCVKDWNPDILANLRTAFEKLDAIRKEAGISSDNYIDVFRYMDDEIKNQDGEYFSQTNHGRSNSIAYDLRMALAQYDDVFHYGGDIVMMSDFLNYPEIYEPTIKISKKELEHIQVHPEEYAVAQIKYK